MRWAATLVAVIAAATAAAVTGLLFYGGDRHDPVGQLSPVAQMPAHTAPATHTRAEADD